MKPVAFVSYELDNDKHNQKCVPYHLLKEMFTIFCEQCLF